MEITEFEKIEKLKKYFRSQVVSELLDEVSNLKYSDNNGPRDGTKVEPKMAASYEDHGFHHGISKVQALLKAKVSE